MLPISNRSTGQHDWFAVLLILAIVALAMTVGYWYSARSSQTASPISVSQD
jgi:hypothetical protein